MIVTLFVPSVRHPVGGVRTIYELANGLTRRGHQVNLLHFRVSADSIDSVDEVQWFMFDEGIGHRVMEASEDLFTLAPADFIQPYHELIPPHAGRPFNLVQGYGVLGPVLEQPLFLRPCPKVCVGSWLVEIGRGLGVPDEQLEYIPNGIDHDLFRVVRPIDDRPMQATMLYHEYPKKATSYGLAALHEAKRRVPELTVQLFGTSAVPPDLPEWITATQLPDRETLVRTIYNDSRVMVCPSVVEGFGYTSVEAMASGCALVTAANGGSDDFAFHDRTALVSDPLDVATMAGHIEALLLDDERRLAIARAGVEMADQFTWEQTSERLESFLGRYGADPDRYTSAAEPR